MKKIKLLGLCAALPLLFITGCSKTNQNDMNSRKGGYASNSSDESYVRTNGMDDSNYALKGTKKSGVQVVYFDFDRSSLKGGADDVVAEYAAFLLANPNTKLRIEGHTDERGSREYNIALGERRAKSISKILASHGVPSNRYEIISYGAEKPAVRGHDENSWSKNRRANLSVGNKSVG
tara:strand:+ start:7839 stop:8372 length:534 start_codon:yes stop_codon:yes gene_type:complete